MFGWLIQPLERSKQKVKELLTREATATVVEGKASQQSPSDSRRLFGLQLGRNKQKVKELLTREATAPVIMGKAPEQVPSDSLRSLLKTAIADAEEIAASIKMGAQAEAEAEAAKIIAQAEQESQKIKDRAKIAAQREVSDILAEANKKGQVIEVEARQKALQFLLGAGEEVGREISEEYKRAYSRLASSLEELMNEGRKIEIELESKAARMLESTSLELKGFETMLLSNAETVVSPIEPSVPAEIEFKPDISSMEEVEESVQLEEEVLAEKVEESVQLEEEVLAEKVEEPVQLEEEVLAEKVEESVQLEEEVLAEKVEEPVQLEERTLEKREAAPVELDGQELYTGEVELIIVSPVELKLVSRLYNYLQTISELRILYTRGSWDQGTTIIVALDNPVPLIKILSEAPDVKISSGLLEERDGVAMGKSSSLLRGGMQGVKKIKLILKEA